MTKRARAASERFGRRLGTGPTLVPRRVDRLHDVSIAAAGLRRGVVEEALLDEIGSQAREFAGPLRPVDRVAREVARGNRVPDQPHELAFGERIQTSGSR